MFRCGNQAIVGSLLLLSLYMWVYVYIFAVLKYIPLCHFWFGYQSAEEESAGGMCWLLYLNYILAFLCASLLVVLLCIFFMVP